MKCLPLPPAAVGPFSLARSGPLHVRLTAAERDHLHEEFETDHNCLLPGVIEPTFLPSHPMHPMRGGGVQPSL